MTVADKKVRLRRAAIAVRRSFAIGIQGAGEAVRDHLLAALDGIAIEAGAVVAAYWPTDDEIDTRPTLIALDALGYRCALPVVLGRGNALIFRIWTPATILQPATYGLLEPPVGAVEAVPRLVLLPLLAFDGAGYRLGQGAGYYDRTLALLRSAGAVTAIGVAFSAQGGGDLPRENHDEQLDAIVTETGMKWYESGSR
jgi:5-formyltetrahydrofolate cyclo-ligase